VKTLRRAFYRVDDALNRFGVIVTQTVSSMWCALAFAMLALISLPDAIHNGRAAMVAWLAQTFLQLTLLSIIMVGQEVQSEKIEARDIETHDTVMSSHRDILDSHTEIHATLARHDVMLAEIHGLIDDVPPNRLTAN